MKTIRFNLSNRSGNHLKIETPNAIVNIMIGPNYTSVYVVPDEIGAAVSNPSKFAVSVNG
jgi:hypothetical protein